jgi:hypothetical protein
MDSHLFSGLLGGKQERLMALCAAGKSGASLLLSRVVVSAEMVHTLSTCRLAFSVIEVVAGHSKCLALSIAS